MACWSKLFSIALGILSSALVSLPAAAQNVPTLWGVDEDDGSLFSIDDYTTLSGLTIYGALQSGGSALGKQIEAFTLDTDGTAYMAINAPLGGTPDPILLSFDIATASEINPNVVTVLGTIDTGTVPYESGDNISGLSIQPGTGRLYALFKFRSAVPADTDRLLIIDKSNGALIADLGEIVGVGERAGSAEDIEFDSAGNLYLTDNEDDHLYQLDPNTGAIIAVSDSDETGGLGAGSLKFEGLGWDPVNERLVASDDIVDLFAELTLENGNNTNFGTLSSLTDASNQIKTRMAFQMSLITVQVFQTPTNLTLTVME